MVSCFCFNERACRQILVHFIFSWSQINSWSVKMKNNKSEWVVNRWTMASEQMQWHILLSSLWRAFSWRVMLPKRQWPFFVSSRHTMRSKLLHQKLVGSDCTVGIGTNSHVEFCVRFFDHHWQINIQKVGLLSDASSDSQHNALTIRKTFKNPNEKVFDRDVDCRQLWG